jgi:hypothetical protein
VRHVTIRKPDRFPAVDWAPLLAGLRRVARPRTRLRRTVTGSLVALFWTRGHVFRRSLMTDVGVRLDALTPGAFDHWTGQWSDVGVLRRALMNVGTGGAVLDIGADGGLFALAFALHAPGTRIYSAQSPGQPRAMLRKNLELNSVSGVAPVGLSTFLPSTTSRLPGEPLTTYLRSALPPILDEQLDLVHIDVGGAERFVLLVLGDLLRRSTAPAILLRNDAVLTRIHGYHPVENLWLLRDFGYEVIAVDTSSGDLQAYPYRGDFSAMALAVKRTTDQVPSGTRP